MTTATRHAASTRITQEAARVALRRALSRPNGTVAHEMIFDGGGGIRRFSRRGVEELDVAKTPDGLRISCADGVLSGGRHIDIEPTESESQEKLDRFCDAMIAIRQKFRPSSMARPTRR